MRLFLLPLLALISLSISTAAPKLPKPWSIDQLPKWDAGVRGGIPHVAVKHSISADVLAQSSDPAATIQNAIDSTEAPGAILLPEGTYELTNHINLRSGIVLRGQDNLRTTLRFTLDLPKIKYPGERPALGSIRFEGNTNPPPVQLSKDHLKGVSEINVSDTSSFAVGDMVEVFSENDPSLMYTEARWNKRYGKQALAQSFTIVGIDEDTITLDTPLRLNYYLELNPRIRTISPIQNAGLENLSLERVDSAIDSVVGFEGALNCWVKNCESSMASRGHIWVNHSRFITVLSNEVHHAFSYGGGGNGYGIVAGNVAVDCLFIDNIAHNLRHSYMAKKGSNGNVFAYNYSHSRRRHPEGEALLCDISLHGHYAYQNLFEGNVAEFIDIGDHWGPIGPDTTFFRNRILKNAAIRDYSHHMRFIGNLFQTGGINPDITVNNTSMLGNLLPAEPNPLNKTPESPLPDSLYFQEKPDFWGDLPWPSIGPGTDTELEIVIPAQRRWDESMPSKTDC